MFRYGDHRQRSIMRYEPKKFWTELLIKPSYGRSDFQTVSDFPSSLSAEIMVFSRMSRINPGPAGCEGSNGMWKKSLNSFLNGKKITLVTPQQKRPWIQLKMKRPMRILAVTICLCQFKCLTFDMIRLSSNQDS